jgi:hypothetical protein
MAVNVEAMRQLAKSVLSCALLSLCSQWGSVVMKGTGVTGAVQWASVVILLSGLYYLQIQVCLKCWQKKLERRRRRSQYRQAETTATVDTTSNRSEMEEVDLDSLPPVDEVWVEGASVVSNNVYYPELTVSSVWTYVYGWGLLLFVCMYCLSGLDVCSSCWWVLGMVALSFDELISKGVGRLTVGLVSLGLCGSVFAVRAGTLLDGGYAGDLMFEGEGTAPLVNFVMGVVLPIVSPFIFFSIRSTVRSATQDVSRLCEFALPFMAVLAGCCLVATSGVCEVAKRRDLGGDLGGSLSMDLSGNLRRDLAGNSSVMVETVAKFYVTGLDKRDMSAKTLEYLLVFISPVLAFWLIRVLIVAILTRHATEFITGFILVAAARYGMTHAMGPWSVISISGAGITFLLLLFER